MEKERMEGSRGRQGGAGWGGQGMWERPEAGSAARCGNGSGGVARLTNALLFAGTARCPVGGGDAREEGGGSGRGRGNGRRSTDRTPGGAVRERASSKNGLDRVSRRPTAAASPAPCGGAGRTAAADSAVGSFARLVWAVPVVCLWSALGTAQLAEQRMRGSTPTGRPLACLRIAIRQDL